MSDDGGTFFKVTDKIFSVCYFTEFFLKIFGLGFIINKGSYLRDTWNILDFVIIIQMTISIFLAKNGDVKLNALRSFRVLRPLRTISSIGGLRLLVSALISALPLLRDTIIILIFFFAVFAIAGTQTMSGNLMRRCFNPETGLIPRVDDLLCGQDSDCIEGYVCGKGQINPNLGITNFDTIFYAFLLVFQSVTLEGWSTNMLYTQQTTSYLMFLYFVPLIIIGAFFLVNLTLAVINSKFNETHKLYQAQAKKALLEGIDPKKKKQKKNKQNENDENIDENGNPIFEECNLNFRKYIIAKKAAKRMIEFLRERQYQKRKKAATQVKNEKAQRKSKIQQFFEIITSNKNQIEPDLDSSSWISSYSDLSSSEEEVEKNDQVEKSNIQQSNELSSIGILQSFTQNNLKGLKTDPVFEKVAQDQSYLDLNKIPISNENNKFDVGNPYNDIKMFNNNSSRIMMTQMNMLPIKDQKSKTKLNEPDSPFINDIKKTSYKFQNQQQNQRYAKKKTSIAQTIEHQLHMTPYDLDGINEKKRQIYQTITAGKKPINISVRELKKPYESFNDNKVNFYGQINTSNNNSMLDSLGGLSSDYQPYGEKSLDKKRKNQYSIVISSIDNCSQFQSETNINVRKSDQNTIKKQIGRFKQQYLQQSARQLPKIICNDRSEGFLQQINHINQTSQSQFPLYSEQKNDLTIITKITDEDMNIDGLEVEKTNSIKKRKSIRKKRSSQQTENTKRRKRNTFGDIVLQSRKNLQNGTFIRRKSLLPTKDDMPKDFQDEVKNMIAEGVKKIKIRKDVQYISSSHFEVLEPRFDKEKSKGKILAKLKKMKDYFFYYPKQMVEFKPYQQKLIYKSYKDTNSTEIMKFLLLNDNFSMLKEQPYETVTQIGYWKHLQHLPIEQITHKSELIATGTLSLTLQPKSGINKFESIDISPRKSALRTIDSNQNLIDDQIIGDSFPESSNDQEKLEDQEEILEEDDEESQNSGSKSSSIKISSSSENKKQSSRSSEVPSYVDQSSISSSKHQTLEVFKRQMSRTQQIKQDNKSLDHQVNEQVEVNKSHDRLNFEKLLEESEIKRVSHLRRMTQKVTINQQQELIRTLNRSSSIRKTVQKKKTSMNFRLRQAIQSSLKMDIETPEQFQNIIRQATRMQSEQFNVGRSKIGNTLSIGSQSLRKTQEALKKELEVEEAKKRFAQQKREMQYLLEKLKTLTLKEAKDFFEGKYYHNQQKEEHQTLQIETLEKVPTQKISEYEQTQLNKFEQELQALISQNYADTDYELKVQKLRLMALRDPVNAIDTLKAFLETHNFEVKKKLALNYTSKKKEDLAFLDDDLPSSYRSEIQKLTIETNQNEEKNESQKSKAIPQALNFYKQLQPQNLEEVELDDDFDQKLGVVDIQKRDYLRKKKTIAWSGQDVLGDIINDDKAQRIIDSFNAIRVWPAGLFGYWIRLRFILKKIVNSNLCENFMTISVIINTVTLGMDRYQIPEEEAALLSQMNFIFTIIFCVELSMKLIALGLKRYLSDNMNYMDGAIVLLSLVELAMNSQSGGKKSSLQAFRTVRIFRTFRVLRVTRLLRGMKSMKVIMGVIQRSFKSFIYITLLMFLFVYIYALLGVNLIGDIYVTARNDGTYEHNSRANFDSFFNAFITTFQILTMENWQTVLYDIMYFSTLSKVIVAIYLITWIFIGNFILLNLFLAILLDSFIVEEEEEELEESNEKGDEEEAKQNDQSKDKKKKGKPKKKQNFQDFLKMMKPKKNLDDQFLDEIQNMEDLDQDEIISIIQKEGLSTGQSSKKVDSKQIDIFKDNHSENTLFLFSKKNKIRIFLMKLTKHNYFERFILFLIIASSIKLATDSYFTELSETSIQQRVSLYFDYFFSALFTLEALFKIFTLGFVLDKGSYLRETWNILDFFIVVSSLLDLSIQSIDLPVIKILRLLRTLRPLRFISHNLAMKTIVMALIESIGAIINVMIVVMIVWLMFAILGVSFFGGKFFHCTVNKYHTKNERICINEGGEWVRYSSNFDNVAQAMVTLFVLSSLENWPDLMYQAVDATGIDQGPKEENSFIYSIFFIAFILIGTFFFLNFFIGVLFLNFNQAQAEVRHLSDNPQLDRQYQNWKDIQRMIVEADPDFETTNVPKNKIRKFFHSLVTSNKFDIFIMSFIFLNMIQMMCYYEGAPREFLKILDDVNLLFTAVFTMEAIFKLIAFGRSYYTQSWNKFDFTIVLASYIEIIFSIAFTGKSNISVIKIGPAIARILRVFRITRVLRLVGKYEGIQALISTIMFSLPSLFNVFSLIFLILFIYAVLGVFMFNNVLYGNVIEPEFNNFRNFSNALLFLFRIATGEDWNSIMYDTLQQKNCKEGTNCVTQLSLLYFMSFKLVCTYVMLNLFILVIIQQFDTYYLPKDNILAKFKKDLQMFKEVWRDFTMLRYNCIKIKDSRTIAFFKALKEPLGMSHIKSDSFIKMSLLKMGIRGERGYIYFNEMLYRVMKRVYGEFNLNRQMYIMELRTQYKIELKTLKQSYKSVYGTRKLENMVVQNLLIKDKSVNPFLTVMFLNISFNSWKNINMKQKRKIQSGDNGQNQADEPAHQFAYVDCYEVEIVYITEDEEEEIEEQEHMKKLQLMKQIKDSNSRKASELRQSRKMSEQRQNEGYQSNKSLPRRSKTFRNEDLDELTSKIKLIQTERKQRLSNLNQFTPKAQVSEFDSDRKPEKQKIRRLLSMRSAKNINIEVPPSQIIHEEEEEILSAHLRKIKKITMK